MISKEKLFLIAGNVDDSIKSSSAVYDISIFKSFVEFEEYAERFPIIVDTIVLSAGELQFTNTNMARLEKILESPFVTVKSSVIYLVDASYDLGVISRFLNDRGHTTWSVYQGDLSPKFIAEVLSGERRDSVEGQVDIVTYRMRTEEYVKQLQQRSLQDGQEVEYVTDEERLSGIPNEKLPEDILPMTSSEVEVSYVVGKDSMERTLMTFIIAQYRALSGKTLIVEKDIGYHRMTDIVTKAGVPHMYIDIEDVMADSMAVLGTIRKSMNRLIVVGCKNRYKYDYNFIMDILETNLMEDIAYIIRECNFDEVPFGRPYIVVMRDTVPEVIEGCNMLRYDIDTGDVVFVGVMLGNLGPVNISSMEMADIIVQVIGRKGVRTAVVKVDGVVLNGGEANYDILSIIGGDSRR